MTDPDGANRAERALRHLAGGGRSESWRDPAALRRLVRRRRRTRFAAGTAGAVVVAVAITLAVALPGGSGLSGPATPVHVASGQHIAARSGAGAQLVSDAEPLRPIDPDAEAAVARAEQAFTLGLLRQLDSGGRPGNVVVSPSSLAIALAMLRNGAAGRTAQEIDTALHTSGLAPEQLDAGWAALMADLGAAGEQSDVTVQSANSLWLQQNLAMAPDFMRVMARYFRTGVWQVDFRHHLSTAQQALNHWVSEQTHGKITSLFNPGDITPDTVLVLANAVYFQAAWKYRFDSSQTADGTFTTADGTKLRVPFMRFDPSAFDGSRPLRLPVARTAGYAAVQLPYAGGRFAALAIMPKGRSLADFVAGLTADELGAITRSLSPDVVDVRLPRFTLRQYTKLNQTLAAMGMPTAFTDSADFSAMSSKPLEVQTVAQRASLQVDEHGTEAAAVTGVGVMASGARFVPPMVFDHPFLFLVRDTKTGAILFAAQVQNPAQ
jgi:serpin B